jgi:hypothetical protein
MPKQKIPIKYIYKTNNMSTIFFGKKMLEPDTHADDDPEFGGILLAIIHAVTLPFSILGAHIKTILDYVTRKPIELADLQEAQDNLMTLSDAKFDCCINGILKYEAKSDASQMLISELILAKQKEAEAKHSFQFNKKQELLEAKMAKMKIFRDSKLYQKAKAQGYELQYSPELSKDDMDQLREAIKSHFPILENERRNKQKQLIINYLQNIINAGKKLQNIIVSETKKLTRGG